MGLIAKITVSSRMESAVGAYAGFCQRCRCIRMVSLHKGDDLARKVCNFGMKVVDNCNFGMEGLLDAIMPLAGMAMVLGKD